MASAGEDRNTTTTSGTRESESDTKVQELESQLLRQREEQRVELAGYRQQVSERG